MWDITLKLFLKCLFLLNGSTLAAPPCAPALTVKYFNDIRLPAFYQYDL